MSERHFQFNSFELSAWTIVSVCAVMLAIVTIVMLFRYERRLVSRSVGNTLIVLRIVTLILILLTFLEPVLTWSFNVAKAGRLVVALDVSDSMNTKDRHASDLEKLQLARALKMIGNKQIDGRLDRWEASFSANQEPEWVDENETANPEKRAQLAESRKNNLASIFEDIDQLSRKDIAKRILLNPANPIFEKLQERGQVDLVLFAGDAVPIEKSAIEAEELQISDQVHMELSNLSQALKSSSGSTENSSSPISSYILLTDGRDNSQLDPIATAEQLGQMQLPVYPIVVGSAYQPKDISVSALDYPQTAFKEDRPLLKARIGTNGYKGQEISVILKQKDEELIVKKFTPRGVSTSLEFELKSDTLGRQEFTLETDVLPGETRDDNNKKDFTINFVDDKSHVLLLEETARWEYRFLHTALERDKRVDLEQVLFEQPYMGLMPKPFYPNQLKMDTPQVDNVPDPDDLDGESKPHPFGEKDLIIIGDVSPDHLTEEHWKQIKTFVADQGGTLVLQAGKKFFPLSHQSETLKELLPLENIQVVDFNQSIFKVPPSERGMRLTLTPEGEAESLFQFDVNPELNRELWYQLPGHLWVLQGDQKPGTTVLVNGISPFNAPVNEKRDGVIIHRHYGSGQIIWIGTDSTWRWRFRVGDRYHHRFWGQLARWAARNKAGAGNEFVKFSLSKTDIEAGEIATATARWSQDYLDRFPNVKSSVAVSSSKDPEKVIASFELIKQNDQPLVHEARVPSLPTGEYELKLITSPEIANGKKITIPLFVHEVKTIELGNLTANPQLLSKIADSSGGKLLTPQTIDQLLELLPSLSQETTNRDEISLWDHWLIMVLIMGILTAEWAIRKLNGLP